jgi:2-polyprenyl-6-methoxyphenol hydroxylase-like FAD-dependent oxidoreductase
VRTEQYQEKPQLLCGYYAYWSDLPADGFETYDRPNRAFAAWPTNDDLTLVGIAWRANEYPDDEPEQAYFTALHDTAPAFAERVREAGRAQAWMRGSIPNFFRRPFGPGWALVGDSSYSKDPCTAQGITDAFRDAESLVGALHQGLAGERPMAAALADHERRRNAHAIPYYEYTCDFATLDTYPPEVLELLALATQSGPTASNLVGLFGQTVSPADFFSGTGMRSLLDSLPEPDRLGWRLRLARWLLLDLGRYSQSSSRLAERLIARKLGEMGQFLVPA